jgi:hypothetical protein
MSWHAENKGSCWHCRTDFEFLGFPQLTAERPRPVPKAVLVADSATCFYHATNQAEAACETCGRFVCAVCTIDFGGRRVCPPCITSIKDEDAQQVTRRTLYDGIALGLAVLPILAWPVTLITAPAALGCVIFGWRKPRSIIAERRTKLVMAGMLALIQIAAWVFVLGSMWLK